MARPSLSNSRPAVRPPLGPADLDPLDAAATDIPGDPIPGAAADPSARSALQARRDARTLQLMAQGMSMAQASMQEDAEFKQERADAKEAARQSRQAAAQAEWDAAHASVDPLDEPRTPAELRGMGLFGEREPGPARIDGLPIGLPEELTTEREARDYTYRAPVSETDRAFRRRGMQQGDSAAAYDPSQRDLDMAARGFAPVYGDDGEVGYSVAAPIDEASRVPGAPGRRGRRADLEAPVVGTDGNLVLQDGQPVPRFESVPVRGPTGIQYVYRPSPALQEKNRQLSERNRIIRQAEAAGMSSADMAKLTPDERVMRVADARAAQRRELETNRRRQQQNPFITLGDPNLNEWQQFVLAQGMLSGRGQVTDPNAVQAQSAENALRLMRADGIGGNPAQALLAEHTINTQRQQALAAREDELGDLYAPPVFGGYDEFEEREQQDMYDDLVASGHSPDEARRAVSRQASKRRATRRLFGSTPSSPPAPMPEKPAAPGLPPATGGGRHPL